MKAWDEEHKQMFVKLCSCFCDKDEVCAIMGVSQGELDSLIDASCDDVQASGGRVTFEDAFKVYSAGGRASLRRMQFKQAMSGDKSMLMWLGKQYLGQSDRTAQQAVGVASRQVEEQASCDEAVKPTDAIDFLEQRAKLRMAKAAKGKTRATASGE